MVPTMSPCEPFVCPFVKSAAIATPLANTYTNSSEDVHQYCHAYIVPITKPCETFTHSLSEQKVALTLFVCVRSAKNLAPAIRSPVSHAHSNESMC